jgi:hypothetical protein
MAMYALAPYLPASMENSKKLDGVKASVGYTNPKQTPMRQVHITETGRIEGPNIVAPGFHAGRLWLPHPPGMETGRYNRVSLFVARFGLLSFGHSCLLRISDFEFGL